MVYFIVNMGVRKILLIIGSIGAFVLLAACTGGNNWIFNKHFTFRESGLWKLCRSTCISIDDYGDQNGLKLAGWVIATRAFAIISCLAAAGGIIISILGMVSDKVKGLFASIFLFAAAGCMASALIIYSDKKKRGPDIYFGWSYIAGWIGAVGALGTGLIGLFA